MKTVLFTLLLLASLAAGAQVRPVYFIGDSLTNDKSLATYYGVFGKVSTDSVYTLKLYDLRNNLVQVGFYADSLMQVPTGRFSYYRSVDSFNYDNGEHFYLKDSDRFLAEQGFYLNGKKQGRWFEFFPNGKIKSIQPYVLGVRQGEYQEFNRRGKMVVAGYYITDLRSGEWKYLDGKIESYRMGILIAVKQ